MSNDKTEAEIADALNLKVDVIRKWKKQGMPWPWEPSAFLRWYAETKHRPEPLADLEEAWQNGAEICLVLSRIDTGICVLTEDFEDENLSGLETEASLTLIVHPSNLDDMRTKWKWLLEPFQLWPGNPNSPLAISAGLWREIESAWELYGQESEKICILSDFLRCHFS